MDMIKRKDKNSSSFSTDKDKDKRSSSSSSSKNKKSKKDKQHHHHHKKDKKHSSSRHRDRDPERDHNRSSKSKRRRRSRSASSNSSEDSFQLLMKLESERKTQLEETKKRKELLKALETPEEKRLRRLAKKEAKERSRKERMGWDSEYLHYTNVDNPFGDHNLLETFMWKKKLEKDGLTDVSHEEVERINRLKQEENKLELEKVKKRRLEREAERAQREEDESFLQRQKEAEQFKEWGNQEDVFHLEQATLRSKIRIKDGRAKPIDLLAQYILSNSPADDGDEQVVVDADAVEMHEPYTYLNGLTVSDLEDLIEDITVYKQLENGKNRSYWTDITVIVEDELRKLKKLEQDDDNYRVALERREGINPSVAADVAAIFKGKSALQLQALKSQIQGKLDGSSSGVDISYWESLLSQLKAHIARAQLRDRHQENLKRKLALLKAQQGVEASASQGSPLPSTSKAVPVPAPSVPPSTSYKEDDDDDKNVFKVPVTKKDEMEEKEPIQGQGGDAEEDEAEEEEEDDDYIDECIIKYNEGSYSPTLITSIDLEPGIFIIGQDEDNARLDLARSQVLAIPGKKVEAVWTAEEKALQHEAKKGMGDDEATFAVESNLANQIYLWSDKYRPRKPRYFNRVHTGFEWNKYNQTHYDMDNPPPKIVQGYKFNIFFPDLIDKNNTPQYYLTACKDNPDFAILRFSAGPPYEDIAFKIVNREWEYSYKRGFRCQFHNNIFQLWFHFKRYRYRR